MSTPPFELMFSTEMRLKNGVKIINLMNSKMQDKFNVARAALHTEAKKKILNVQNENQKTYNFRRR